MSTSTQIEAVDEKFDENLTPSQHQALSQLANGQSISATARACNLHRSTISHWQHENPDFARALRDAKHERTTHWHSVVDEHAVPAFAFIRATMNNDQAPLAQRLRAAFFLATQSLKPAPAPSKYELQQEQALRAQREREQLSASYNAEHYPAEYEETEDDEYGYDEDLDPTDPTLFDTLTPNDMSDHPAGSTDPTHSDTSTPAELSSDRAANPAHSTESDTSTPATPSSNHPSTARDDRDTRQKTSGVIPTVTPSQLAKPQDRHA